MRTLHYGLIISLFSSNLYSQNVGIGTNAPLQKLHIFNGASGNTAPTFPPLLIESATNAYINIVTPASAEKGILFGHAGNNSSGGMIYNNTSFTNGLQFRTGGNTTRMAIASNGFVGIGAISNLEYILDVNGRMRVRSGGDNTVSAGIWLNNHSQAEAAFIGMEDNNYVGLYGVGAGWRFSMNIGSGALKINGSEGAAGQVLHSNGSGSAASWKSLTNVLYSNTVMVESPFTIQITESSPERDIGLQHTFSLSGPAKVLVSITVPTYNFCNFCGPADLTVGLYVNDVVTIDFYVQVPNYGKQTLSGNKLLSLGAGTYTLKAKASVEGPDVNTGAAAGALGNMIVQIIPQ